MNLKLRFFNQIFQFLGFQKLFVAFLRSLIDSVGSNWFWFSDSRSTGKMSQYLLRLLVTSGVFSCILPYTTRNYTTRTGYTKWKKRRVRDPQTPHLGGKNHPPKPPNPPFLKSKPPDFGMIFSKFFNFFEKYFFEKSSRMVKMNFAADAKSTSRIFFDLENPEISTVLDPKLVGGRGQYFALRQSKKQKIFFFFFERVFHTENTRKDTRNNQQT